MAELRQDLREFGDRIPVWNTPDDDEEPTYLGAEELQDSKDIAPDDTELEDKGFVKLMLKSGDIVFAYSIDLDY